MLVCLIENSYGTIVFKVDEIYYHAIYLLSEFTKCDTETILIIDEKSTLLISLVVID